MLDGISRDLAETPLVPVDPTISVELQDALYASLRDGRSSGALHNERFPTAEQAVSALTQRASSLGGDVFVELYTGSGGTGFFLGPVSHAFLLSCLERDHEGAAVVTPDASAGAVLDHAVGDPLHGDFYEVEWWG